MQRITLAASVLVASVLVATLAFSIAPLASAQTATAQAASSVKTSQSMQDELLVWGFGAASAIPSDPHLRDKAAAQENVALAAIQLGLTTRAAGFANGMENWRRGSVYGQLAIEAAKAGRADAVKTYATLAEDSLAGAEDWQRDRVLVKLAQAHAWLGDEATAARLEKGVGEAEVGKVAAVNAARAKPEDFDAQLAILAKSIATKDLDVSRNAFEAAAQLAKLAGTDDARWTKIEEAIAGASVKIPRDIKMEALLRLSDVRSELGAKDAAKALIAKAVAMRVGAVWMLDSEVPISASIARRLFAAGDIAGARAELDSGMASFEANKAKLPDVFRAQALCPAAEAFARIGETARAKAVYDMAITESQHNPNSRPRAEDLARICASIARSGIEPDPEMVARIRACVGGLKAPW